MGIIILVFFYVLNYMKKKPFNLTISKDEATATENNRE